MDVARDEWGFTVEASASPENSSLARLGESYLRDDLFPEDIDDLFDQTKTNARNGKYMTSLSEFVALLAKLGIEGPFHLKQLNIRDTTVKIGRGSQFTVFRRVSVSPGHKTTNEVIKRVNVAQSSLIGQNVATDPLYRRALRHLELEVLSLSHDKLRRHRNIVRLLAWGC